MDPRHSSWWQYRPGPSHGLRWQHWLLTSSCSLPPSSLQFCLSSPRSHPSASPSLPSLHHLLAYRGGAWGSGCLGSSWEWSQESSCALPVQCDIMQGLPAQATWHKVGVVSSWDSSKVIAYVFKGADGADSAGQAHLDIFCSGFFVGLFVVCVSVCMSVCTLVRGSVCVHIEARRGHGAPSFIKTRLFL